MDELNTETFDAAIAGPTPVLVDFWAPWCGPCKALSPVLDRVATAFAGRVRVAKVNVDDEQGLAARFGIGSIPALVVFKHGKAVDGIVGAVPQVRIEDMLQRHCDAAGEG